MKVKKVLNKLSDPLVVQRCEAQKNSTEDQLLSLPSPLAMNTEPPDPCTTVASTSAMPPNQSSSPSTHKLTASSHNKVPPLLDYPLSVLDETEPPQRPPSLIDLPFDKCSATHQIIDHLHINPFEQTDDGSHDLSNIQTVNEISNQSFAVNANNGNNHSNGVHNCFPNHNLNDSLLNNSFDCSDSELQRLLEDFVDEGYPQMSEYLPSDLSSNVAFDGAYHPPVIPPQTTSSVVNNAHHITAPIVYQTNTIHTNANITNQSLESNVNHDLNSSVVSIDLSENSNSPESVQNSPNFPKLTPIVFPSTVTNRAQRKDCGQREPINDRSNDGLSRRTPHLFLTNGGHHTVLSNSAKAMRSQANAKSLPFQFNYCAQDYRIFNMTRTSGRNKSSTQNEEYEYDVLKNMSWAECDGSQYEAKVKKWSEDEMNEDRRKEILRNVQDDDHKKFVRSAYESDKNVFYWWTAFVEESYLDRDSRKGELRCVMRLDTNAIKGQRFAKYETRFFILVGTVFLIVENGKQKKMVDVGHEVVIPAHTRFGLENKSPDECYLYCIISN